MSFSNMCKIGRDIVINDRKNGLTRIHETRVLFLPLQYPGGGGGEVWGTDIPH
jgi:hypothetical protein